VLVFVPFTIYPVSHGGASRITNMLWGLTAIGHEVHVLSAVANETEQEAMRSLPNVASSEANIHMPLSDDYTPGGSVPAVVRGTYRPWLSKRIGQLIREYSLDLVQLEYTHAAAYMPAVREQGVPVVLMEHDIAFASMLRQSKLQRPGIRKARTFYDALRLHRWELEQARRADLVLTASEREAEMLRRRGIERVSGAVPNGGSVASLEPRGPRREERDILFVGFFGHPPNADGLEYFATKIWPFVREANPSLRVSVVGPRLAPGLLARVTDLGFRYAGYVEDLAAELWSHKVFIVPIRYGAGTRIKVLEAAAAKCAMVSTTLGAEGIALRHERDLLLADKPGDFAKAVNMLLADADLRARLGSSAHEVMKSHYDWPILVRNLERLYYGLVEQG
jgi:glycosyltransferase involved in cell wall biosynthesis